MAPHTRSFRFALHAVAGIVAAVAITASLHAQSSQIANADDFDPWPFAAQGDLNRDLEVNVSDLLILLGNWGPCPRNGDCLGDLNSDGSVNVSDLLVLLSNWGSIDFTGTEYGVAWVWPDGPYDFVNAPQDISIDPANLVDTLPLQTVLLSKLGQYDSETGERIGDSEGALDGKYLKVQAFTLDMLPFPPGSLWPSVPEFIRPDNDFRIDPRCWGGFTGEYSSYNEPHLGWPPCPPGINQRTAALWHSQVQAYYFITEFRRRVLTDDFVDDLELPEEIATNIKHRQFRPDLVLGGEKPAAQRKPIVIVREWRVGVPSQPIVLDPINNFILVPAWSRGPDAPHHTKPILSKAYTEAFVADYPGLIAYWLIGDPHGFPGVQAFDFGTWQNNSLPPLNDGLSSFEGFRWAGRTTIYNDTMWLSRQWSGSTNCQHGPPSGYTCNRHGINVRNVMMFNPGQTDRNGVYPFNFPSAIQVGDGPNASNVAGMYFAGIFYDVATEAGLGEYRAAMLYWKTISLIEDADISACCSYLPMHEFGALVLKAARLLWPSSTPVGDFTPPNDPTFLSIYEADIADVLTSRGIPLYGISDFADNLPAAIGPTLRNQTLRTSHPAVQPSVNGYDLANWWPDEYRVDSQADYVAYTFYKHSKLGPCDHVRFMLPDGEYDSNGSPRFDDSTIVWQGEDRALGNLTVFMPSYIVQQNDALLDVYPDVVPGQRVNILRSYNERRRCPSEAEGWYQEDVRPLGYRVVEATPDGFSFTVKRLSEDAERITYQFSIVDPSIKSRGSAAYSWVFTEYDGLQVAENGLAVTYSALRDEPLSIQIERVRMGILDTLTLRERGNDLDRRNGSAFVYNAIETTHQPQCGDSFAGGCLQANGTPSCNDSQCCELVCDLYPECCEEVWSAACATYAQMLCLVCNDVEIPRRVVYEDELCGESLNDTNTCSVPPEQGFGCGQTLVGTLWADVDEEGSILLDRDWLELLGTGNGTLHVESTYPVGVQLHRINADFCSTLDKTFAGCSFSFEVTPSLANRRVLVYPIWNFEYSCDGPVEFLYTLRLDCE